MSPHNEPIDLGMLAGMLSFISADLPREEWARLLMAAKSEFGDAAKGIMQDWSATASNYKPADFMATWKSIKPSGGVTIATLVHEAKQNGYRFAPISQEDKRRLQAEQRKREAARKQNEAQAALEREQLQREAKEHAIKLLRERAVRANPDHAYFVKKGIATDVRLLEPIYQFANTLIVPVYELGPKRSFELCSLQYIDENGGKFFLKNGKTKGAFYPIRFNGHIATIVICEGFATGVTLATRYEPFAEVVCAFNARNLLPVAREFKRRYPLARMIIAGDNDRQTERKTGVNVGVVKATEAARMVDGALMIPTFADNEDGTDWNDRFLLDLAAKQAANTEREVKAYG